MMELVLDMTEGAVYLNFEVVGYGGSFEMNQAQVLSYLEHHIQWD